MTTKKPRGIARAAGSVLLWVLAIVGAVSGALWAANMAGLVQPLIVVSGSMSPEIERGDLLFATRTPAGDLRVGDVATLPSAQGGVLVTHRIVELDRTGDRITIRMQGDANTAPDGEEHVLNAADPVWTPSVTIPGAGSVVETVMQPTVGIPLLVGLLALVSLTLLPPRQGTADEQSTAPANRRIDHIRREKVTA